MGLAFREVISPLQGLVNRRPCPRGVAPGYRIAPPPRPRAGQRRRTGPAAGTPLRGPTSPAPTRLRHEPRRRRGLLARVATRGRVQGVAAVDGAGPRAVRLRRPRLPEAWPGP